MSPVSEELRALYQDVILDHYRSPRNFGELDAADSSAEGYNPLCGDQVKVSVRMDGDVVEEVCFEGTGCAISTASASLMTEAVKGEDPRRGQGALPRLPQPGHGSRGSGHRSRQARSPCRRARLPGAYQVCDLGMACPTFSIELGRRRNDGVESSRVSPGFVAGLFQPLSKA